MYQMVVAAAQLSDGGGVVHGFVCCRTTDEALMAAMGPEVWQQAYGRGWLALAVGRRGLALGVGRWRLWGSRQCEVRSAQRGIQLQLNSNINKGRVRCAVRAPTPGPFTYPSMQGAFIFYA